MAAKFTKNIFILLVPETKAERMVYFFMYGERFIPVRYNCRCVSTEIIAN